MVELALVLPVLLLLLMVAIDFGRIYLGWVNLQNMARIAANYAANNATALTAGNPAVLAAYQQRILDDARAINCDPPLVGGNPTFPAATFPGGTSIGGTAQVSLTCTFHVITPIISAILGSNVTVGAGAVFPIKRGMTNATGGSSCAFTALPVSGDVPLAVQFTDLSTVAATSWTWDFGDGGTANIQNPSHTYAAVGTYDVRLSISTSQGPCTILKAGLISASKALCVVPTFIGKQSSDAPDLWSTAKFTGSIYYKSKTGPPTTTPPSSAWTIGDQDIVAGSSVGCDVDIKLTQQK